MRPTSPGRARLVVLGFVSVALVLAGLANATIRPTRAPEVKWHLSADAFVTTSRAVRSSAWYCPGPLPIGAGPVASSIALANLGGRVAHVKLVLARSGGAKTIAPVSVAAHAERVVGLARRGRRSEAAVAVLVQGVGVGVDEILHGPFGPSVAPCLTQTASSAYLAPGDSEGADNVVLSLYDPSATPAVADVALATSTGVIRPPALQGVPIGAGSFVTLDIGRALPGRAPIATSVHARGGEVVAGALLTVARGHGVDSSLVTASLRPARRWTFPPVPAGPTTSETLALYNPGRRAAQVLLRTGGSGGMAEAKAAVPAGGVVTIAPGSEDSSSATRFEQLSVTRGDPIVVGRELVVAPSKAVAAFMMQREVVVRSVQVHGRMLRRRVPALVRVLSPLSLPALPAGFAVGEAVSAPARRWLVPAGESDRRAGELLEIANPGSLPTRVSVQVLQSRGQSPSIPAVVVRGGGAIGLSLATLPRVSGDLALVVRATQPIVVSGSLYARGTEPALGVTTPIALPLR